MVARGGSWRSPTTSVMPRPDSSVVERGPEKAGVGGSIPSLATTFSTTYKPIERRLRSETFQPRGGVGQLPRLGLSESTGTSLAASRRGGLVFSSGRPHAVVYPQ